MKHSIMAAIGTACLVTHLAVGAEAPGDMACKLVLQQAVTTGAGEGRDLELSLDVRGGKVVAGFGRAPRFNKMPAALDLTGLACVDGKLTGVLTVRIESDGWVPAAGKPFIADYKIEGALADGKVTGKWSVTDPAPIEGTIAGTTAPRAADTDLIRLTLACANAIDHHQKIGSRGLQAVLVLKDGKGVAVRAIPAGSIADVGCSMEVPKFDLKLADGKLTGMFEVKITPQGVEAGQPVVVYSYQVNGVAIGDGAGGTMSIAKDGVALKDTALFIATARRGEPPRTTDCTYKLTLHHALGAGKFIDVYLATSGGQFTGGFASSPNFNNAMHTVDVSKLKVGDGKLTGDLGVIVQADPWIPRDHQPIPCRFAIEAALADGEITGQFKGTAGTNAVVQALDGALNDKVKLDKVAGMTIRLENGLAGDGGHMARAFVSMELKDGKVVGGNVGNNHDRQMKGTVTGGTFKLTDDEWTLKVEFNLTGAGRATLGKYVATASGTFVGTMSAGVFTCSHEAGSVKQGTFWAAVKLTDDKR